MQEPDSPTPDHGSTIAEFFARDPQQHTKQSLDGVIEHLRGQRKRFKAGDKTAGNPKPKTKTQKAQDAAMELGKDLLGGIDL